MGRRVPWKARIGIGLILASVGLFGGWRWWMVTRTWVPLDMPISLARGHIRSPEFKINLDAGFWVRIEVETEADDTGVTCLLGYNSDYCLKNGAGELEANWTLSDSGKIVAHGSTGSFLGWLPWRSTKARGLGSFEVPAGDHYVLDLDMPEDHSRFDVGHPRLVIVQNDDPSFEETQARVFFLSVLLAVIGVPLLVSAVAKGHQRKYDYQTISLTVPGPLPAGFVRGIKSSETVSQAERKTRRLRSSWWLGLVLLVVGLATFITVQRWMSTRIVLPVDMPVSLAAGHIRSGPFRLNLETSYWVSVDPGAWWNSSRACAEHYPQLRTRTVLYRQGKVVEMRDERRLYGATFYAEPGEYELDVEVLSDFSCLDKGHPRLSVSAYTWDYDNDAFLLKLAASVSAFFGVALLAFLPAVRVVVSREKIARVTDSAAVGQDFQWARRLPLRRPISGLPAFGLFGGMVFALLALLMMLLTAGFEYIPRGFWVHVLKSGQAPAKSDAWTEPLIVRVKDAGPDQAPKLFVNSKEVPWTDLDKALKQELAPRRDWVVYVGGDDATSFQHVANVIDAARGLHAKVVLITEKNKSSAEN
jgi:biopolymer transport protein ExbD